MFIIDQIALKRSKFSYQIDGDSRLPIIKKTNQLIISNPIRRPTNAMETQNLLTIQRKIIAKRPSLRLTAPIIVIIPSSHKIIKPQPAPCFQTKKLSLEINALKINPNL